MIREVEARLLKTQEGKQVEKPLETQTHQPQEIATPRRDIYLESGALTFTHGLEPTRDRRLERAQTFLEAMRVKDEGPLTFGGKLSSSGVDRLLSLLNYYPSLKTAQTLASREKLSGGVERFLPEVSVPEDLRDLVGSAVGELAAGQVAAERAQPLGTLAYNNAAFNLAHQAFAAGRPAPEGSLGLSDVGVRELFTQFYKTQFNVNWFLKAADADKPNIVRLYARAQEIGVNLLVLTHFNQMAWPETPEMEACLRRLANAFGFAPEQIAYAGKTLADRRAASAPPEPTPRRVPTAGELPSKQLGTRNLPSHELQAMLTAHDPRLFELDDPGLELLILKNGGALYNVAHAAGAVEDPAWHVALLNAWDRATALRLETVNQNLANYSNMLLPASLHTDPNVLAALARAVKRAGLNPSLNVLLGGTQAAFNPEFQKQWENLDKIALGASAPLAPSRQDALEIPEGQLGASSMSFPGWQTLFSQRNPAFYEPPDSVINGSIYMMPSSAYTPDNFHNAFPHSGAVSLVARFIELGNAATKAQCATWLRKNVPAQYSSYVIPLLRLAKAAEVPASEVKVTLQSGQVVGLDELPAFFGLSTPRDSANTASELAVALSRLDPVGKATPAEKLAALDKVLGGVETAADWEEVVAATSRAIQDGKLAPVDFGALSEAEKQQALAALTHSGHLGVSSVLSGLFAKDSRAELANALEELGYSRDQAEAWSGYSEMLQNLPVAQKLALLERLGTRQPDFELLPLTLELAASKTIDAAQLDRLFAEYGPVDPSATAKAFVDAARDFESGSAERKAVGDFIRELKDRGALNEGDLAAALTGGGHEIVFPEIASSVQAAVSDVLKADPLTRPGAEENLAEVLERQAGLVPLDELAADALTALYQGDLADVLPLAQADQELGGVAPKAWQEEAPTSSGDKRVTVAGIEIQANEDPKKDAKAVPRKASSELIMTATTERNLRLIAAEWRRGRPVLLEGPTSAGKTSAIRYLAHVTGSPYRRINLSYHTDVSDLLGRYVGGEKKFARGDLEKMNAERLRELGGEYGLEEGISREQAIEQLFEAQAKPRWVDGPVVKAMRRGEVLLLDEINLARPEVIERLNSLFDDDGNLVLTEHRNEVVAPQKNFRIFSTMNPANYAGRARLSEAMRSRWTSLYCQGLNQTDLSTIMRAKYGGDVPDTELAKLIAAHDALARAADGGEIGRSSGGVAFSLRNLFRVADRFVRYSGGELSDDALMRRETEEIYRGGLFDPEDIKSVDDLLNAAMPYSGPGFYDNLEVEDAPDAFTIGDVTVRKLKTGHALVPSETSRLVLTQRTKEILYRLAKALDCGENVGLIGERASGKTAVAKMFAHLIGQPYYRQLISASTDTMQLVGGYDDRGWKDGLLLDAGRPENVPGMLLLDELNLGSSALLERLNPVLDDERKIVLAEKEGEEVRLNPDFRFVGAMNPPTREYGGRNKLSKAMQNRLTQIYVPDLNGRDEQLEIMRAIAAKKGVPQPVADALVELQQWAASAYEQKTLGKELKELDRPTLSIRQLLNALDMVADFQGERGAAQAYLTAAEVYYASTVSEADNQAVLEKAKELAR